MCLIDQLRLLTKSELEYKLNTISDNSGVAFFEKMSVYFSKPADVLPMHYIFIKSTFNNTLASQEWESHIVNIVTDERVCQVIFKRNSQLIIHQFPDQIKNLDWLSFDCFYKILRSMCNIDIDTLKKRLSEAFPGVLSELLHSSHFLFVNAYRKNYGYYYFEIKIGFETNEILEQGILLTDFSFKLTL